MLNSLSNVEFYVPELKKAGVWLEYRHRYKGGYGWRGDRNLNHVKYLTIHHTASTPSGSAEKDIAKVAHEHINNRGWGGIGYHIIVTSEETNGYAKVAYVGDIGSIRAHAINAKAKYDIPKNKGNIYLLGISIVGNFVDKSPTDAQLRSTHRVAYELIYRENSRISNLKNWDNLKTHKDFDYTACAGNFDKYKSKIITPPTLPINDPPMPNNPKEVIRYNGYVAIGESRVPIYDNPDDKNSVKQYTSTMKVYYVDRFANGFSKKGIGTLLRIKGTTDWVHEADILGWPMRKQKATL